MRMSLQTTSQRRALGPAGTFDVTAWATLLTSTIKEWIEKKKNTEKASHCNACVLRETLQSGKTNIWFFLL